MAYIYLAFSILANVGGQILMKLAADQINFETSDKMALVRDALTNVYVITGGFLYLFGLGMWLLTLSRLELSVAYPFQALTFVFVIAASFVLFKEPVTAWKIASIALIFAGILMLSFSIARES